MDERILAVVVVVARFSVSARVRPLEDSRMFRVLNSGFYLHFCAHPHFNQKRAARLSHRHRSWYGFEQASNLSLCFLLLSHHLSCVVDLIPFSLFLSLFCVCPLWRACSKSDRIYLRPISHRLPRQKGTSAWPLAWSSLRVYPRR